MRAQWDDKEIEPQRKGWKGLSWETSLVVQWLRLHASDAGGKVKVKSLSRVRLFATPWTVAQQAPLWNSPGKNTGVGCHFLLQGIFPTQGLKLGLLHCRQTLYCLGHQGTQVQSLVRELDPTCCN